jgi:hypothetical protein
VAGSDEQQFPRCAEDAKATCPVSRALAGPEIILTTKLVQVDHYLTSAESCDRDHVRV